MKLLFKFFALICIFQTNVLISSISVNDLKNSNLILLKLKQNHIEIPKISKQRNPQHGDIYSSDANFSYKSEPSDSADNSQDSSDNSPANNNSEKANDIHASATAFDIIQPQSNSSTEQVLNSGTKNIPVAIATPTNANQLVNSLSALSQQHTATLITNSQSLKNSSLKGSNASFASTLNPSTLQGATDITNTSQLATSDITGNPNSSLATKSQTAAPIPSINQQNTATPAEIAIPVTTQPLLLSSTLNKLSNSTAQQSTRNQTSQKLIPVTQGANDQVNDKNSQSPSVIIPKTTQPKLNSPSLNKSSNQNIYPINNSKSSNNYAPAKATINLKSSQNLAVNLSETLASQHLGICYTIINNNIYDLTPLAKLNDANFVIKSLSGKITNFNICGDLSTNKCSKQFSLVASDDCEKYAGSSAIEKRWILGNEGESSKLVLQLPEGDDCSKVTYEIVCKPDKIFEIVNISEFDTNKCEKTIKMESKHACAAGVYTPWYTNIKLGKVLIASIMLILGLFFLIYGTRFSSYSLTVILGLSISFIFYFVLKNTLQINFIVYLIIGYLIAVLILIIDDKGKSLHKLCSIVILGFLITTLLYTAVVASIRINTDVLYWILFFGVCTASLALWTVIGKHIISISTSLVGSYLIVRAFGIYFNNYPDEILMSNLIQKREYNQLRRNFTNALLVYLCVMAGLCILGTFIQKSIHKEYQKQYENDKLIENEIKIDQ